MIGPLLLGDCVETMQRFPDSTFDAIVTDPPYGLEFMGKEWDKLQRDGTWAVQTHRGTPYHRSGPRTSWDDTSSMQTWHHTWALEALRVLKPGGYMVCFGGTRTHHRLWCAVEDAGFEVRDCLMFLYGSGFPKSKNLDGDWQGWGTALKPAWEPILLARKPLEGTVAHNVQKHGTGALNVDGCRIAGQQVVTTGRCDLHHRASPALGTSWSGKVDSTPHGRWPANLVLDEEAAAMLDAQTGELSSGFMRADTERSTDGGYHGDFPKDRVGERDTYGDSGGPSRFFYTSKAGPDERGGSKHPTVKPRDLMLWLCKLITPPGGLILDPFIGSGTTAVAARMGGFRCVGIDNNEEYLSHAAERLRLGDEGLCEVVEARRAGAEQGVLW